MLPLLVLLQLDHLAIELEWGWEFIDLGEDRLLVSKLLGAE